MDTQSYKTVSLKAGDIKKEWVVIDATDLVLGRLASSFQSSARSPWEEQAEFHPAHGLW